MEKYYKNEEWYHLIPLLFLVAVVPLIVYLKIVPLSGAAFKFWNGQKENADFFSYYKMVWIIVSAVATLIMVGAKYYQNDFKNLKRTYYFYPIACYIIFVILSTLLSQYKDIALYGFVERYEGMYVLLSYMIILVSTIILVNSEKHIKILLTCLYISAILIGLIGATQYFGFDFWKSNIGKSMIIPPRYEELANKLSFEFGPKLIYSTLYNINYVGSYTAMIMPLSLSFFIISKNKLTKVFMGLMTLFMAFILYGSKSRAGLIGTFVATIILIVVINKYLIKHWKQSVIILSIAIIASIGGVRASHGLVQDRINALINDIKVFVTNNADLKEKAKEMQSKEVQLQDIKINKNKVTIVTLSETLNFEINSPTISFYDGAGNPIKAKFDNNSNKILLLDPKYKDYDMTIEKLNGKPILNLKNYYIKLFFELGENNDLRMIDNRGNYIDLKPVEKFGFEGKEKMGSMRGYIWSRTIPLIKNTIIKGYGPDTFAIYFPQYDFTGKMYAFDGDMWQLVDKPHNYYLQVAVNTGLLSLISLLSLFLLYIVQSIRIYMFDSLESYKFKAGVSIFVANCGYLAAAIFNDSVVSVAPVFWTLLGIGISVNILTLQDKINQNKVKQKNTLNKNVKTVG